MKMQIVTSSFQYVINAILPSHCSHPQTLLKTIYICRGFLPNHFQDLTWIEEQVCSKYQSTTFVTHLNYVNDPKHPYVLHGNTCAFDQNIISTAAQSTSRSE